MNIWIIKKGNYYNWIIKMQYMISKHIKLFTFSQYIITYYIPSGVNCPNIPFWIDWYNTYVYACSFCICIICWSSSISKIMTLFKKESYSRKKICPALHDVYFLFGAHFQAADDKAIAAISLLTAHVMKTFLHYLI